MEHEASQQQQPVAESQEPTTQQPTQEPSSTPAQPPDVSKNWRDYLPADYQKEKMFQDIPDLPTLAKNYKEAQTYISKTRAMPKDDASDEEWSTWYQNHGAYDDASKYTIDTPDIEGFEWKEDGLNGFKTAAKDAGISQRQLSKLMGWYTQNIQEQIAMQRDHFAQLKEQQDAQLKQEWGGDRLYTRNMGRIEAYLKTSLTPDEYTYLEQSGLKNDVVFRRMLSKIAAQNVEDSVVSTHSRGWMSKDEIQSKKAELMKSPEYMKGDERVVNQVLELNKLLTAE